MIKAPTRLYPAEHFFLRHAHIAPVGVTMKDVCDPSYWVHVAPQLAKFHSIEVVAEDFSFECTLRVVNATKGALALRVIERGVMLPAEPSAPAQPQAKKNIIDGLEVAFGGAHKWRVIEVATKDVISHGLGTQQEAEAARDTILNARKAA